MSSHVPVSLTSALRRRRLCSSLQEASAVLAAPSASWSVARRHHNSSNAGGTTTTSSSSLLHHRRFSTAPRRQSPLPLLSLAVRLLQPSSAVDFEAAAAQLQQQQRFVPLTLAVADAGSLARGPAQASPPQFPTAAASGTRWNTHASSSSPSPPPSLSSFPIEFVNAYSGAIDNGMALGLSVVERDRLRTAALSSWLQLRRRGCGGGRHRELGPTPFTLPPLRVVRRCLAEEIAAAGRFFSAESAHARGRSTTTNISSSGSGDGPDGTRHHSATWHAFCLKTLFEAAVTAAAAAAAAAGEEEEEGGREGAVGEAVRHAFMELAGHVEVPRRILDMLMPILAGTFLPTRSSSTAAREDATHSDGGETHHHNHRCAADQWRWQAEVAALCSRRVEVWDPVLMDGHRANNKAALTCDSHAEAGDEGGDASTAAALASVLWLTVHNPLTEPQQTWAGRRRWRGRNANQQQQQQRALAAGPPRTGADVDGRPVDGWAVLERMWSGHFAALVASSGHRKSGPSVSRAAMRTDAGLAAYAARLQQQLGQAAAAGMDSDDAVPPPPPLSALAAKAVAGGSATLAELAIFLTAMTPPAELAASLGKPDGSASPAPAPALGSVTALLPSGTDSDGWSARLVGSLCDALAAAPGTTAAESTTALQEQRRSLVASLAEAVAAAQSLPLLRRVHTFLQGRAGESTSSTISNSSSSSDDESAFLFLAAALRRSGNSNSSGGGSAVFAAECAVLTAEALVAHWRAVDAGRDRQYRFPPHVARALWQSYVPAATRLLTRRAAAAAGAPGVAAASLAVCAELALVWDSAVCLRRQQVRRVARHRGDADGASLSALEEKMERDAECFAGANTGTATAAAVGDARDYPAAAPVPQRTVDYALLLTAALETAADADTDGEVSLGGGGGAALVADSVALSRLCSGAMIVLREVDARWALRLVAALDTAADGIQRRHRCSAAANGLDTRAALAVLRCVGATRFGCPAPALAVKYFSIALRSDNGGGRPVDWQGEVLRVIGCISNGTAARADRCAALVRFVAAVRAADLELDAPAHSAVQLAFAVRRPAVDHSHQQHQCLFTGAPFDDVAAQYRGWLAGAAHVRLLLRLPELQLDCARSLLALGRWEEALAHVPSAEVRHVRRVMAAAAVAGDGHQRGLAALHTLLFLCSTDPTRSCEASARAVAARLLAESPTPAFRQHHQPTWQRWFRAARALPAAAATDDQGGAAALPRFRPCGGLRFVPLVPAAAERDGELRARFTAAGERSYLAQCCGTLARTKIPLTAIAAKAAAVGTQRPSTEIGTSYVGVAAALKNHT